MTGRIDIARGRVVVLVPDGRVREFVAGERLHGSTTYAGWMTEAPPPFVIGASTDFAQPLPAYVIGTRGCV